MTWALNQPREGRDFIYVDDGHGGRQPVWLTALNQESNWYNGA